MGRKRDKASTSSFVSINNEVKASANVKVSDIAGMGALAKTPAGKAIAQNVSAAISETIRMASVGLLGPRANKAEADRIVLIAQAESQAKLISAETEAELLARAGDRVRTDEMRRQAYIEEATVKAIEYADAKGEQQGSPEMSFEFVLEWIDGVKNAHFKIVRDLYSKILAAHAVTDGQQLRGPTMMLLKQLDGELAQRFVDFCAIIVHYRSYPNHGNARPQEQFALSVEDMSYLRETGFVKTSSVSYLELMELHLRVHHHVVPISFPMLGFTRRSWELAKVLFEGEENIADFNSRLFNDQTSSTTKYLCLCELHSQRTEFGIYEKRSDDEYILRIVGSEHYSGEKVDMRQLLDNEWGRSLSNSSVEALNRF